MFKYVLWNVDQAKPVGAPVSGVKGIRSAIRDGLAREARTGRHYAVVPL